MPASKSRPVDVIAGAFVDQFDPNERRKFTIKNPAGDPVINLYFKPLTRADRNRAEALAQSDRALNVTTHILCQMAELEDGSKAFAMADVPKLQRELPESVLNELELFLFDESNVPNLEEAKND